MDLLGADPQCVWLVACWPQPKAIARGSRITKSCVGLDPMCDHFRRATQNTALVQGVRPVWRIESELSTVPDGVELASGQPFAEALRAKARWRPWAVQFHLKPTCTPPLVNGLPKKPRWWWSVGTERPTFYIYWRQFDRRNRRFPAQ